MMTHEEAGITINQEAEHALRANLDDYKSKLVIGDRTLPDPYTLRDGWLNEEAKSKWPSIYNYDISGYLKLTTPEELHKRIMNEYKQQKAFRYGIFNKIFVRSFKISIRTTQFTKLKKRHIFFF